MIFLSGCCQATMVQKTELNRKSLPKPFDQLSIDQKVRVTFWHYCDRCGNPTKVREWIQI